MAKYDLLMQAGLERLEDLFCLWKLPEWSRHGREYHILAFWRGDRNADSCKFNPHKNKGNDFARDIQGSDSAFKLLGDSFDKSDFKIPRGSFDLIGLCLRVKGLDPNRDYHLGAKLLQRDLEVIGAEFSREELEQRAVARITAGQAEAKKKADRATNLWTYSTAILGTDGEKYLESRGIYLQEWHLENVVKFHRSTWDDERPNGRNRPVIVFKVSDKPDWDGGKLKAVQRVYLSDDCTSKAPIANPKKGLAAIQGNGIWFGSKRDKLYICEGPEDALTLRTSGECSFVCCCVAASFMASLNIPDYVNEIVICADNDDAGRAAAFEAHKKYTELKKTVKIIYP